MEVPFEVPLELFAENRKRISLRLQKLSSVPKHSLIFLQGGVEQNINHTDTVYLFRQESYFQWAFGVNDSGFYGAIDVDTSKSVLFVPKLSEEYAVWMGNLLTLQQYKEKYGVDRVEYIDDMKSVLHSMKPSLLLTLNGKNTDSHLTYPPATFEGIDEFKVDSKLLYEEIAECRVIKTPLELEVLRYVNKISSEAHKYVMRNVKAGMTEYQAEAMFTDYCYFVGGCRYVSYTCICGTGQNSSILHYGHAGAPNDKIICDNDMCLFDMGASYAGYASDITCSYPVSGKFTDDQKLVYNAVLDANEAVMKAAKPGVSWVDMHRIANETVLSRLKAGGLLVGDVSDMMNAGLGAVFQPHGLGHLMGCDVHDVGGYLSNNPPRPTEPGFSSLRTARNLEAGMVLTIEPGCYFICFLLDRALADPVQSKFLVPAALERFRSFGGVRIEDDVLITETGTENLTVVPRTVQEIEQWMATKDDKVNDILKFKSKLANNFEANHRVQCAQREGC